MILWGLPGRTHTLWAWTIKPEMTPIFMGSAYGAGAVAFYGWTGLYIASPFVVAYLWLRNQRTDSGTREPRDPQVPQWVRLTARAASVAAIAAGLVFLFSPTAANDVWAWKLTPLTAGVVGSFTIQVGVGALLLSLDERWSAWRLLLETFLAATA